MNVNVVVKKTGCSIVDKHTSNKISEIAHEVMAQRHAHISKNESCVLRRENEGIEVGIEISTGIGERIPLQ